MKANALLAGVVASALTFAAHAAEYAIDKRGQHAFVNFKASHLGYSYVIGRFNDFDGTFMHDPENPAASEAQVIIQAKSLDTNHAERDKHLRSDEFFNVDKYPTITFESTGYEAGEDGDKLNGKLTMLGVTKDVAINLHHIGEGDDPWGGYRSGFEGSVMLSAADFGMPDWVGDVEVELNIEGVRQ